jgi:Flp pilus assembly protein TadD
MEHQQRLRNQRFLALAAEVNDAVKALDMARGVRWSETALAEGFVHPTFLNLVAYHEMCEGRPSEALKRLKQAKALSPSDADILNGIGTCHATLGDLPAALSAYDEAIAAAPTLASAYFNRGIVQDALGNPSPARTDFERAVALRPAYPEALAKLAYDAAIRGAAGATREYARRALDLNPHEITAIMACAMADVSQGDFERAEKRLSKYTDSPLLTLHNRAILFGLVGDARDAATDYENAFDAYTEANDLMRKAYTAMVTALPEPPLSQVRRLLTYFESLSPTQWSTPDDACLTTPRRGAPVFLVGFPRSGTTLLEQALAGHPDVATSEEKYLLHDAIAKFIETPDGLDHLRNLSDHEVDHWRQLYWDQIPFGARSRKCFIDKLPLNVIYLPIIAKLFPSAKIIFAYRDPRDVIFSCFRRRFAMTPQMYELLTLGGAAQYYNSVMHLAEIYRMKLNLSWCDVKYEGVVLDFEDRMKGLCSFLGLEWKNAICDFSKRVAQRSVDTPSSRQLVKGLSRESIGCWSHYARQMEPVIPLLSPWMRRFGYS